MPEDPKTGMARFGTESQDRIAQKEDQMCHVLSNPVGFLGKLQFEALDCNCNSVSKSKLALAMRFCLATWRRMSGIAHRPPELFLQQLGQQLDFGVFAPVFIAQ